MVITGVGFTVTLIVKGLPAQPPTCEVGVTRYCTLPALELLGLVSVCAIVLPAPAVAPVMPPVMVPIVHVKLLGTLADKPMLVATPLQAEAKFETLITGVGCTVTIIVNADPTQPPGLDVGVT